MVNARDEHGTALVAVLLLLMLMTAVAAALSLNGHTEALIVRNELATGQAQAAAEAGLNHAVEVAIEHIFNWKALGFASSDAAVDDVLADANGGTILDLDGTTVLLTTCTAGLDTCAVDHDITAGVNAKYYVEIVDDPAGSPPATSSPSAMTEDANALDDLNEAIVIRAKGTAYDGTEVVLEAYLSALELGALVTNGDLTINGNITVDGAEGSVHANGNLTTNGAGNSASISGDITASGSYTGSLAGATGGEPTVQVPSVEASAYRSYADYLLASTGLFQCDNSAGCSGGYAYGATIYDCTTGGTYCRDNYGFAYTTSGGTPKWSFLNDLVNGTYYVETDADINGPGNPSGGTPTPVNLTVIAEGSIAVSGNTFITPHTTELLFVTDVDLTIAGGVETGELSAQGQILVHEQVSAGGSSAIAGQLIIENATDTVGSPVSSNTIGGTVQITYDGGLGSATYTVVGWRDVRQ
ncbi:MAG: hypothetical protein HYY76_01510 [Acidobacteria bacterium]|nr:hypothetical protein [Acidobacteriota bacterium]